MFVMRYSQADADAAVGHTVESVGRHKVSRKLKGRQSRPLPPPSLEALNLDGNWFVRLPGVIKPPLQLDMADYGIGIGLRVPHYNHILSEKPTVDWFEIISENFMVDGGRPLKVLDRILEQCRSCNLGRVYFGSVDRLNREHLKKLKRLVRRTNTPWLSDHLCWGQRMLHLHT